MEYIRVPSEARELRMFCFAKEGLNFASNNDGLKKAPAALVAVCFGVIACPTLPPYFHMTTRPVGVSMAAALVVFPRASPAEMAAANRQRYANVRLAMPIKTNMPPFIAIGC